MSFHFSCISENLRKNIYIKKRNQKKQNFAGVPKVIFDPLSTKVFDHSKDSVIHIPYLISSSSGKMNSVVTMCHCLSKLRDEGGTLCRHLFEQQGVWMIHIQITALWDSVLWGYYSLKILFDQIPMTNHYKLSETSHKKQNW